MNEYVISVGGGGNQLPFIVAAKEEGYRVIVVDVNKEASAKKYADIFINKSIVGELDLDNIFKDHNIVGAFSEQTDTGTILLSNINKKFSLKGISTKQAIIVSNKFTQREFVSKLKGVLQPKFDLQNKLSSKKRIAKPITGQSSMGVHLCSSDDERVEGFIYEEFIDGVDYSIDGFISKDIFFTCFLKNYKYTETFVNRCYFSSNKIPLEIINSVNEILYGVGAKNVFFHMEFRLCEKKYYLIEFHLRGGGSGISTKLASYLTDISMPKVRLNLLKGVDITISDIRKNMLNRFVSTIYGNSEELTKLIGALTNCKFSHELIKLNCNPGENTFDGRNREYALHLFSSLKESERIKKIVKSFLFPSII